MLEEGTPLPQLPAVDHVVDDVPFHWEVVVSAHAGAANRPRMVRINNDNLWRVNVVFMRFSLD